MNIILHFTVYTKNNEIVHNYSKQYESLAIPSVGMMVKDDLFAVEKEVIKVVLDYSKNRCSVTLTPKEETKERIQSGHIQEVADLHNWKRMNP